MSENVDASTCLNSPVANRTRAGQAEREKLHGDPTPKISNKNITNSVNPLVLRVFIDEGSLKDFYKKYSGDFDSSPSPSGVAFAEVKNVPGCNMKDDVYLISNESNVTFQKMFSRALRKGNGLDVRAECSLKLKKEWFNVRTTVEVLGSSIFGNKAQTKKVTFVSLVDDGKGIAPKIRMNQPLQRWILIQASYHGLGCLEKKDGSVRFPSHRLPRHNIEMFFNGTIDDREWNLVAHQPDSDDWATAKNTWRLIWDDGADDNTFLAVRCGRFVVEYKKKAWSVRLFDDNAGVWLNSIFCTLKVPYLMKVYEVFFFPSVINSHMQITKL